MEKVYLIPKAAPPLIYRMYHHRFATKYRPRTMDTRLWYDTEYLAKLRHPLELVTRFTWTGQYLVRGNNTVRYRHLNNRLPHLFHRPLSSEHLPHPANIPISNYFYLCMGQASKRKRMRTGCSLQSVHKISRTQGSRVWIALDERMCARDFLSCAV
jgi:hypothetical protein